MSIIPASHLSASDLARLGNNITARRRRLPSRRRRVRQVLTALNRSLVTVGEQVDQFVTGSQDLSLTAGDAT